MLLSWHIRYLDRRNRDIKDRHLWLVTDELDAVTKAAVEMCYELKETRGNGRDMLKYRHLFHEREYSSQEVNQLLKKCRRMGSIFIHDYDEDENGKELTGKQMAVLLTGSESAVMLPPNFKQHDIEYMLAEKRPIDVDKLTLTAEQLRVLGYFARDLCEMTSTAFYKEGPGTLSGAATLASSPPTPMTIQTAVTDEEIRSFVMIFRRLYMKKEPANFQKAAALFTSALGDNPFAKWIASGATAIAVDLDRPPAFVPYVGSAKLPFTLKLLIDVFLYTQYAHQPDARRSQEFEECLRAVGGDRSVLTYLFLDELWSLSIDIRNVGQHIAWFYDAYCQYHKTTCDIVTSPGSAHPGIGSLEKKDEREDRIRGEKAEELAKAMWEKAGRPAGGYHDFLQEANAQLNAAMHDASDGTAK